LLDQGRNLSLEAGSGLFICLINSYYKGDSEMSRYTFAKVTDEGLVFDVAYGFDHAMGYFFQEFGPDGELVSDLDSLFGGLTGLALAQLLCGEENLIACLEGTVPLPDGFSRAHLDRMVMDLPF
jgi:hypothetical protein